VDMSGSGISSGKAEEFIKTLFRGNRERGTDAAGVYAYRPGGMGLLVKAPYDPEFFVEYLPFGKLDGAQIIIAHNRAYTSCPPSNNYCNHPLAINGTTPTGGKWSLILVHNGVIDDEIPHSYEARVDSFSLLVKFKIEHEKKGKEAIEALKEMLKLYGRKAIIGHYVREDGQNIFFWYRNTNPLVKCMDNDIMMFASLEKALPCKKAKTTDTEVLHYMVFKDNGKTNELVELGEKYVGSYSYGYSYGYSYNYKKIK